jgi:hypothetical protein
LVQIPLNLRAVAKKHVFGSEAKLAGKSCQLMLCGSAILSLFSCVGKQKFLHFIAVVSGFVALCLTVGGMKSCRFRVISYQFTQKQKRATTLE